MTKNDDRLENDDDDDKSMNIKGENVEDQKKITTN